MNGEIIRGLVFNASLLLSISILYNIFFSKSWKKKKLYDSIFGIVIGFIGILLMINAVPLSAGLIFDMRSILVSVTGLFFGFIPTAIAVFIICCYRIFLGGQGMITGLSITILTACTGLLWHRFRFKGFITAKKKNWVEFYLFGLVTHIVMLACMLALPQNVRFDTIRQIGIPILTVYPIASLLLCIVVFTVMKNIRIKSDLEESELRFRTIFEQAPIGIVISNKTRIIYVNSMYEKIVGRSKDKIISVGWESYTHPDDLDNDLNQLKALKAGEIESYSITKRYLKPNGSIVWVDLIIARLKAENQLEGTDLCMIQDITEIKKAEENLKKSETSYKDLYYEFQKKERLLVSLLDSIPDLIFYKDLEGRYLGGNRAFEKMVGLDMDKIIGRTDYDLFDKQGAEHFMETDTKTLGQKDQIRIEEVGTYPDGTKVMLETLKTMYYSPEGKALGLIGISRDVTERNEKEKEIVYLNYHDILTGLYNRTYFDKEIKRLDTKDKLPISFIVGDINGLKIINDAFGHEQGDKLLVETGKMLSGCCREGDIIARTGGDEFCILLPKTDNNSAKEIFHHIEKSSEEYSAKADKDGYFTSISLGYATKKTVEESFESVYKEAEENMYRRKLLERKSLHSSLLTSIKSTMFEKSNETEEHAERLSNLTKKLGKAIGLGDEELVALELASTLHDLGKLGIDQNILKKPGKLNYLEWAEIKKHPIVGYRIAQAVPELRHISEYILSHHERWDGLGYPQGLAGDEIPLLSRILSIVDAYDAMTQDRVYRKAMTKDEAIAELEKHSGTQFDKHVANVFIEKVLVDV